MTSFMLYHSRILKISKEKLEHLVDVEIPPMYFVWLAVFAVGFLVLSIVTATVPPARVPWIDKRASVKSSSSSAGKYDKYDAEVHITTSLLVLILMEAYMVLGCGLAIWSLVRGKHWIRKAIAETRLVRNGSPA